MIELEFERALAGHRALALYRRNPATWEMLLALLASRETARIGVYDLVESVTSTGLGNSALLRFVRDRRDDGLFDFGPDPKKRSKHRITLRPDLAEAAVSLLDKRNQAMLSTLNDCRKERRDSAKRDPIETRPPMTS